MNRITRGQVDEMAAILNNSLGLPVEPYVFDREENRSYAQLGCIYVQSVNGANNIYQMRNESGGCQGLAYGLTLREAYTWLQAAVTGVRMARGGVA